METIPQEWGHGLIKPIRKSGPVNNIDNYRGITLTSNVYKLYTKIIENVIMNYIEENSVLHENQGAFKKVEDWRIIYSHCMAYALLENQKECTHILHF